MKRWFMLSGVVLVLAGCSALLPQAHTPEVRQVLVTDQPDLAYTKAVRALAAMGGEIVQNDRQARMLQSRLHNAVILSVSVRPSDQGTLLVAQGTVLPNKVVVGSFTEVEDF